MIATLWDVPDEGARRFLQSLVAGLSRGGDPAVSLREARADLIRQGIHGPDVWAAFQLVGSSAPTP